MRRDYINTCIFICICLIYIFFISPIHEGFADERKIPKVIYQTWEVKELPDAIQQKRNEMIQVNSGYTLELHDKTDRENFIRNNFDQDVYTAFMQLNVGAAKADLWRYCILYKMGGIYIDMDSSILKPLDELIRPEDQCIITREGNNKYFNQWFLIFSKGHPILKEVINQCVKNILNKSSTDLITLTGPAVFTDGVNKVLLPHYNKDISNLVHESDEDLNSLLNNPRTEYCTRFFGVDMEGYGQFKLDKADALYTNGIVHWRNQSDIFI
jgi:mannosyltransferase OCH1-like enzyme